MRTRRSYVATAFALGIFSLSGCAADVSTGGAEGSRLAAGEDWGDPKKYPEIGGAFHTLTALMGMKVFAGSTLTVTSTAAQTIVIGKRSVDSAILVNGESVTSASSVLATTTNVKRLEIVGDMTDKEVVVLDFLGGTFATGQASEAAGGIVLDLNTAADDEVHIRGTSAGDAFYMGANKISYTSDNYPDITVTDVKLVNVSLAEGVDTFNGSVGMTAVKGVMGDVTVPLLVYGGEGNDVIVGGVLLDTIYGGPGNDEISGGKDLVADVLNGEAGNDIIGQSALIDGDDVIDCGADADTVSYALRTNQIVATAASGGEGAEADTYANCEGLTGGTGHDKLVGDGSANTLSGGPGNDTLIGLAGDDVLNGGDGDDTFIESHDGASTTAVNSATGVVDLSMAVAVTGSTGADVFNGNGGTDVVDYSARTAILTVTMSGTAADDGDGTAMEKDNVKADVENLVGGTLGDTITGNALNNVLTGGDGDDTLDGSLGDDTFYEGTAANGGDTFKGGAGTDTISYKDRSAPLTVTMITEMVKNDGASGEADDVQADIENYIGGSDVDTVTGNASANHILGGGGIDVIQGGAGNDMLDGEAASATIDCGEGADIALNYTNNPRHESCESGQ